MRASCRRKPASSQPQVLQCAILLCALLAALAIPAAAAPVDPATFAGHRIGDDYKLVKWPKIVEYFELLARDSARVRIADPGKTTLGNRLIAAVISSPYAFVIPAAMNDAWTTARLLEPLVAAGVEVQRAREPFTLDGTAYPAGSHVIL